MNPVPKKQFSFTVSYEIPVIQCAVCDRAFPDVPGPNGKTIERMLAEAIGVMEDFKEESQMLRQADAHGWRKLELYGKTFYICDQCRAAHPRQRPEWERRLVETGKGSGELTSRGARYPTAEERQHWVRIPHAFDMGGGSGTPDRPCLKCGMPDRAMLHQAEKRPICISCSNGEHGTPVGSPGHEERCCCPCHGVYRDHAPHKFQIGGLGVAPDRLLTCSECGEVPGHPIHI